MKRILAILVAVLAFGWVNGQELWTGPVEYDLTESSRADSVIEEATKYLGTPYRWGGKTPAGFDCAGFARYVYSKFGVELACSAPPQYRQGKPVKRSELQKGDLVFFGGRKNSKAIGHVGIVTDVGSDTFHFIHASNSGVRISISTEAYYRHRFISACRVLN